MNRAQHAALSKIISNIADELDELGLVVDSMSGDTGSEVVDDHYLKLNDAWYWLGAWLNEQEIQDENPARLQ
jgi:hypothetical protein